MANYYISYRIEWKSINDNINRLDILDSELLSDDIKPLKGGATPLLHEYTTDDPFAPVKGSSILVQYANEYDETPLIDFYTENDQRFKAIWYQNGVIRFIGFLAQDDCNEGLSSHSKINTLSFTDNLGLLKNVSYDQAVTTDPYEFINYKDLICKILAQTGLELNVNIFSSLALDGSSATVVSEWGVFGSSFTNNEQGYRDCYSILEDALKAIRASCVQSGGEWVIVRWAEGIYSANEIDGAAYDDAGTSLGAATLDKVVTVDKIQVDGISEIIRPFKSVAKLFNYNSPSELIRNGGLNELGSYVSTSIITLEGVNTNNLVYNVPANVYKDNYKALSYDGVLPQIHIVRDATTVLTLYRSLVIGLEDTSAPATSIGIANLELYPINVNKGDTWNFTCDYLPYAGGEFEVSIVRMMVLLKTDTSTYRPLKNNGGFDNKRKFEWSNTVGNVDQGVSWQITNQSEIFCFFKNVKTRKWNTLDLASYENDTPENFPQIPEDGQIVIRLFPNVSPQNLNYDYYRNFRFIITRSITRESTLKGQQHIQTNNIDAKNLLNESITIDDAPRISIAGALIQNTTDFIKPLTGFWKRNYGYTTEKRKLSEITAFEDLFNRRKPRTKVDATLLNADEIDYTTVVKLDKFPTKNFIFGQFSYNARLDSIDATLYENYEDGEEDADLNNTYTFNFLYE